MKRSGALAILPSEPEPAVPAAPPPSDEAAASPVDIEAAEPLPPRPRTRGDCDLPRGMRPCPYVGCRHHVVGVDLLFGGAIGIGNGPRRGPDLGALPSSASDADVDAYVDGLVEVLRAGPTCVLDLVDDEPDGLVLELVGDAIGVTRERIRQIEAKGKRRLPNEVRRELHLGHADFRAGPAAQPDRDHAPPKPKWARPGRRARV